MSFARLKAYLLPGAAENDPAFREELVRLSHEGLSLQSVLVASVGRADNRRGNQSRALWQFVPSCSQRPRCSGRPANLDAGSSDRSVLSGVFHGSAANLDVDPARHGVERADL